MINIAVKKGIHYDNVSAFITFSYSLTYVNLMRAQPKRYWHSDIKAWEVPYENLSLVIDKLTENDYEIKIDKTVKDVINAKTDITIPETYKFKTTPYQHQIEGVLYGLNHNKFLLGDEQGCIDGDMQIYYNLNGNSPSTNGPVFTLSKLYNLWKKLTPLDILRVRSFNGKVFKLNTVKKVINSGFKPVFKLILSNGLFVNATEDHEILTTNRGFVPLKELKVDEDNIVCYQTSSKVVGKEYVGIKETFDIIMEEPYRNFVVNNITVHNCGKSKQMIDLACIKKQMYGYKHCLIIACVNGLKYNWKEEISVHSNESGYILGTRTNKKGKTYIGSNKERLEDLKNIDNIKDYFIITNIETLRYTDTQQQECKTKNKNGTKRYKKVTTFPIVEELQKLMLNKEISMIVADEVHRCLESGTLVLTDKGLIPIAEIVAHKCYKVATRTKSGNIEYVTPTNYFLNPKPEKMIVAQITHAYDDKFFGIVTKTDQVICTPNHKFLMNDGTYKEIQNIKVGEPLFNGYITNMLELPFERCTRTDYVYDLEIPETHNYIIHDNIVVHNCKDSTSLQGRALLSLKAESVVALTGTPLMNNAVDLFTPLKFIGAEDHSLFAFKNHYCIMGGFGGHQVVGYKNLPELQAVLDKCMLRRLKKDVLDLPEKIYFNDFVDMTTSQTKIYNSILEDLRQNIDKVKLSPNPLTMLIRLRQATGEPSMLSSEAKGNPKFDRLLELVEDIVAEGKKCIVFSNWTAVLNPAYELLVQKGYQPALYTGDNKDTREDDKLRFKTDKNCKVICGTIGAMGTGLTLTEATTVIFLDEPWSRAIKDQAEDRAHRIGTKENLNIITIMCKDTIDEKIHNIVYRKGKMSDIIVDKEEDLFKNPNVINYLLS